MLAGVPAVDVRRGPRIESIHDVAACVCTVDGDVRYERGTIDVPVFLRSAVKPFIAAAVVRSGAAARFDLAPHEIAVMAASHNGEAGHVAAVSSILEKIGARAVDVQCGIPSPGGSPLEHNCSGKHAGILALARMLGAPLASYLDVAHPAERAIVEFCERAFRDRIDETRIGVDGCGIPVIALTLRTAAIGFARFATLTDLDPRDRDALAIVRAAMLAHPWYVAGTDRFDTDLMEAGRGEIVAKGGAEGVQSAALVFSGTGLVLKVIDGARRAVAPATVALLEALGALDPGQRASLEPHARTAVVNAAGRIVGDVVARPVAPVGGEVPRRAG
jgi:L-asparaginase II